MIPQSPGNIFNFMFVGCLDMVDKSLHIPVMTEEVVNALRGDVGGVFLDCTLGGGGHTKALLEANSNNTVYAIDRDGEAVKRAKEAFCREERVWIYHSPFSNALDLFPKLKFDGIVADLGFSADQIRGNRGFSFDDTSELDMRMDPSQRYSAYHVVNNTSPKDLFAILKRGGVGKEAKAVVSEILKRRPITTTSELADAVRKAIKQNKKTDAATVVFQAIRMEVNEEIAELQTLLASIPKLIKPKGRVSIISFHSIEDKIVASTMRRWAQGDTSPALLMDITSASERLGRLITKKPLFPSEEEIARNPSARSAKMRVFEFY